MSATALGIIGLSGAAWLWNQLGVIASENRVYIQGAGVAIMVALCGFVAYWFFGTNRKTVEFFIATEGELKKVNWSTRKEIMGSTWVVIIVCFAITLVLFVVDIFFAEVFKTSGVLVGEKFVWNLIRDLFTSGSSNGG